MPVMIDATEALRYPLLREWKQRSHVSDDWRQPMPTTRTRGSSLARRQCRTAACRCGARLSVAILLFVGAAATAEEVRTWTDQTGTITKQGSLDRVEKNWVHLRLSEGGTVRLPIAWLSKADQDYLASADAPAAKQATAPAVERTEVVIAEGVGIDVEGARKDAYRNAVRVAVGAYVDAETVVANDELIADRIVTLSPAFVEKVEPIPGSEKVEAGLVHVRVRAHVRITSLLDALAEGKIKTRAGVRTIDSASLLAELSTKSDQHEARRSILAKLFRDYPESCLTVSQTGKESIEKQPDGKLLLRVPLSIKANEENYFIFSKTLCEVLSSTNRAGGEFKVDGEQFGPDPERTKTSMAHYLQDAFTDDRSMLGMFPQNLRKPVMQSCDDQGRSPLVGMGPSYHLWDGGDNGGIVSHYYQKWQHVRENKPNDWVLICLSSAKKNFRQTTWRWFHVTGDEYAEWFAAVPDTFRCRTQLLDNGSEEITGCVIDFCRMGVDRRQYDRLLWCVPMYVNTVNSTWYTPELKYGLAIPVDEDDVASLASIRVVLERGAKQAE
jgi:hypothetical protein